NRVIKAMSFMALRYSSNKRRLLNLDYKPIVREDVHINNSGQANLPDLIDLVETYNPDAVYIADYETDGIEDGIASAKTLGYFCDWLQDNYKGITISDSRRVVYNTHIVKTNASEWEQIQQKKAWHKDQ
ncbi:hypothetical protein LRR18_16995, partial [Mangrovimonas sp. AS39]|uniref:hypothetical protein n=1 Tax=Mangrovimonas futianensis TaxID=2895523 RepID=UPI001E618345